MFMMNTLALFSKSLSIFVFFVPFVIFVSRPCCKGGYSPNT
jgi:hypothetical protein